jgi:hypothetical protein
MIWNIAMHVLIGLLGRGIFTFTPRGIFFTLLLVVATQGSDLFRIYREKKIKAENTPAKERMAKMKTFKKDFIASLPQLYAKNVGTYTMVVLVSSEFARYSNIGI